MSVSFKWAPSDAGRTLKHGGSSDYEALKEAFGSPPWILTTADLSVLRGMAAVPTFGSGSIYRELVALVEKHEAVRVWGEW